MGVLWPGRAAGRRPDLRRPDGRPGRRRVAVSESMFQDSVGRVLLVSLLLAVGLSVALAMLIGRRLARPLRDAGDAARRIARGDYASRLARQGPDEMVTLVGLLQPDGRVTPGAAAHPGPVHRGRRARAADAAHQPPGLPGGDARRGHRRWSPPRSSRCWRRRSDWSASSRSLDTLAEGDAGRVLRRDAGRPGGAARLRGGAGRAPDAQPGHRAGAAAARVA